MKSIILDTLKIAFLAYLILLVCMSLPPFIGGIWYNQCGSRYTEQIWLDRVQRELIRMRNNCNDSEVRDVIDYTIYRYSKIGGFDVMVVPCVTSKGRNCCGLNYPQCPGVTIDPHVLSESIHEGAKVLVHEAAHDYYPFFHPYIDNLTDKINRL